MDIFENYLVIYLKNITEPRIIIHDLQDKTKHYIDVPNKVGEIQPGINKVITFILYINYF